VKTLVEKRAEFHTYKVKEERSYRVVLLNMHHSINPEEMKTEIENCGTRSQIFGILNNTELSYPSPWFL
jgi:hypothetical protein